MCNNSSPLLVNIVDVAYCSVTSFDIICNSPRPPQVYIVHFGSLRIIVSLTVFQTRLLLRGFHTLKRNVSFPMESHNPPHGSPTSSLTHRLVTGSDTICNSLSSSSVDIVYFDPLHITVNLTIFQTRLLGRGFHTLIKNASFSSLTNVRSHIMIQHYGKSRNHYIPSCNLSLQNRLSTNISSKPNQNKEITSIPFDMQE